MSQKTKKLGGKVYTAEMIMAMRRRSNRTADGSGWIIPLGEEGRRENYYVSLYYEGWDACISPEDAGVAPTGVYIQPTTDVWNQSVTYLHL